MRVARKKSFAIRFGAQNDHSGQLSEQTPVVHSHHPDAAIVATSTGLSPAGLVRHTCAVVRTECSTPSVSMIFSNLCSIRKSDSPPADRNHCRTGSLTV